MARKKYSEEQIKLLADNIMPGFIPKDKNEEAFSFHFTTEGINYKAQYKKTDTQWILQQVEEVD
ncbi:hypothetical protein [Desertivirga xinjiangensis]|uniref:hypothetical protein n=1 Tax=Desertivirga xinjiangensis TaxID=539206 RepID=UPI00210C5DC6|nr:hypothetical protein [Pedobacter xinjiangensis]